jgi:hypothetical protein
MADVIHKKVRFELRQDDDGYPPDRWERLWAYEIEPGLYCLDNIPFFAKGISSGDVISIEIRDGELQFKGVVRPSANSVFRIYVADVTDVQSARESFRKLGCESEQSHIPKLFSVEIPGTVSFERVARLLTEGKSSGRWDYEEGVLRHRVPQF